MLHRITMFSPGKSPVHRLTPAACTLLPAGLTSRPTDDKISSPGSQTRVTRKNTCLCGGGVCVGVWVVKGIYSWRRNNRLIGTAAWDREQGGTARGVTAWRVWRTLEMWTIHKCLLRAWGRRSTHRNQQDPFFSSPPTDTKENGIEL